MARPKKYSDELIDKLGKLYRTGRKSQEDICREYSIPKGTFSDWKKKYKWGVSEQTNEAISNFVGVSEQLSNIDSDLTETAIDLIKQETQHLPFFQNSGLLNQELFNGGLHQIQKEVKENPEAIFAFMGFLDSHSRATQRNKETVLGKEPTTKIENTNAQQTNIEGYGVKVIE